MRLQTGTFRVCQQSMRSILVEGVHYSSRSSPSERCSEDLVRWIAGIIDCMTRDNDPHVDLLLSHQT